jgi:signal transduction histidine kinase
VSAGALIALRHAAQNERHDIGHFRDTLVRATYKVALDGGSRPSSMTLLRDPATWRDLAYWTCVVPLASITVIVVAVAWLLAPGLVTLAFLAQFVVPLAAPSQPTPLDWWLSLDNGKGVLVAGVVAVVALLAPSVTRAAASVHAALGVALLGPGQQARLQAEVAEQRLRRRLTLEAAEAERRRIERDLHDGAQQRLVSLAMNLGRARQKFASDPASAEQLVVEAHNEAKQALGELRTLARGIHPAVLTDRGLEPALNALVARVPVPVTLEAETPRLPGPVESAAYFVVSEALANVAKYASATQASVGADCRGSTLRVEVGDNGVGGADGSRGSGIRGLQDRVAALGGRVTIDSPPGQGTLVVAEIPIS